MATSFTDILAAIQNTVQALNSLNTTIGTVFPNITGLSSAAPSAGGITFNSSQAATFFLVVSSSGYTYKIPGY